MKTKLLILTAAALALVGCNSADNSKKILVLYYSQTGSTEIVANEIAGQLGVEAVKFDVTPPYTGTYEETIERCGEERKTNNFPKLNELTVDFSSYDVIFLGYPIWYGTCALPVISLIMSHSSDFGGKTIIPFCTFGSGGLESSEDILYMALPNANVRNGYGIRASRLNKVSEEVTEFLTRKGFLEGEVETYPDYGEEHPVTEEEATIFNEACGNYAMPLGTPTSVSRRDRKGGTDYIFTVVSSNPELGDSSMKIYVTCTPNSPADFIKAVR